MTAVHVYHMLSHLHRDTASMCMMSPHLCRTPVCTFRYTCGRIISPGSQQTGRPTRRIFPHLPFGVFDLIFYREKAGFDCCSFPLPISFFFFSSRILYTREVIVFDARCQNNHTCMGCDDIPASSHRKLNSRLVYI